MLAISPLWWRYLHVASAFAFLASHGTSVAMLFRLRKERDRERIRVLLSFSGTTAVASYVSLAALVGTGLLAAFKSYGGLSQRWVWLSLVTLVALVLLMLVVARPYYKAINEAAGARPSGAPRVHDEDFALRLRGARPWLVAALGFGGLAGILYLMVFKPL